MRVFASFVIFIFLRGQEWLLSKPAVLFVALLISRTWFLFCILLCRCNIFALEYLS